jgi:hypothetical protein
MSLLMKALQQAARNRGAGPSGPDAEPRLQPAGTVGDPPPLPAATESQHGGETLPPMPDRHETSRSGAELSLQPLGDESASAAPRADDETPRASVRIPGNPRAQPPLASGAVPAAVQAAVIAADPHEQRRAQRWSGDLQEDEAMPHAEGAGMRGAERQRQRAPGRGEASPARAGSVLAAGAGAARAGALSRVTRLQWIIASGFIAGALLFVYFYIQISYPGLLQRGFRQPSLMAPAATRPAPSMAAVPSPDTAAATAGTVDIGTVPPAGTLAAQQDAMHTPPGSPPSGRATPADVPAALAASPLLNPPPGSDTRAAGSPGMSAPAQAGTARTAPAPGVRAAVPTGPAAPAAAPTRAPDAATTRASTPPPAADSIQVTRGSSALPVNPALADAFDHLQAGRIEPAQRLYSQVAAAEPRNVDALLGLAAVAQLGNQPDAANRLWLRVLEVEPRNAHAQAALLGQLGRADPAAAESQLKTLISREPSPFLYFTLGNLYADQNRWAQAQQAWFQAHHLQPGNADYAFNLAIGLERISQPRLAITYLRTAIRLAEAGTRPNFDVAAARKRAALLEAAHGAP